MPRVMTFDDYDFSPDPRQLVAIYESGFKGVLPDAIQTAYMRRAAPTLYQAFSDAKEAGKGRLSLPYKAALTLDPDFGSYESQTTGDCVSHASRNAGMMDYCVDSLFGETTYKGRFATENIYGWRGHGGQGASCAVLAEYVSQEGPGGFIVRDSYDDGSNSVDLSVYDSNIGHRWGRRGTPDWLNGIADSNKALRVMLCESVEMFRDAIALGFGISCCSGMGFSSSRNEDGVARQRGGWGHAMTALGYDDTDWAHQNYKGGLALIQNSWGHWNDGPKRHDQPDGSFWIEPKIVRRYVDGGECWIIASVRGYDRKLVYDRLETVRKLA